MTSATHLFLIASNAWLECGQDVLYDSLSELGVGDSSLAEILDELREDLSTDDDTCSLVVQDIVNESMDVACDVGRGWVDVDLGKKREVCWAFIFLTKSVELREFLIHWCGWKMMVQRISVLDAQSKSRYASTPHAPVSYLCAGASALVPTVNFSSACEADLLLPSSCPTLIAPAYHLALSLNFISDSDSQGAGTVSLGGVGPYY